MEDTDLTRRRALLGVAVVAGWYLLALVGIGVGIAITAAEVASDPDDTRAIEFLPAAVAALLLLMLRPHGHEFVVPGPRLAEGENRELFGLLREVADGVGSRPFDEVYLAPDARLEIVDRDGTAGFGGRRTLVLGVALLRAVSKRELRALVAHRLARRHAGGSRIEAFIERARHRTERGLRELEHAGRTPITSVPYALNARFFLRSTAGLDRAHELQADREAKRIAGGEALAAVLELQPGLPAATDAWLTEWSAGTKVPFDEFLAREDVARQIRFAAFRRREDTAASGVMVPLQERVARALADASPADENGADGPARELVSDFGTSEQRLIAGAAARHSPS